MKKFLTMLLALSVVFTYTFGAVGSVFATTTDKDVYLAAVDSAKVTALEALNAQYDVAKATLKADATETSASYKIGEYVVCADAWIAALDALYNDIKIAVDAKASALKSASSPYPDVTYATITGDTTINVVGTTKLDAVNAADEMITVLKATESYKLVAAKAQYATDKAKYVAAANGVDTAIYSTTDKTPAPYKLAVTKSYTNAKAYADALVADLVSMLNTNTYVNLAVTDDESSDVAGKAVAMKNLFDDVIGQDANTKKYFIKETGDYAVYNGANYNSEYADANNASAARYNIVSLTEEKVADQNKAYTIQNNINTEYNKIYNGKDSTNAVEASITAADADAIAAWQTLADAYKFVAENGGSLDFPAWKVTYSKAKGYELTETAPTYYVDNVKAYNDTKALIESLKANGKYDAEALDDALDAFMETVCDTDNEAVALSTSSTEIKDCLIASVTDFEKEKAKYEFSLKLAEEADADGLYELGFTPAYNKTTFTGAVKNYYAKEWAEIKAAADAYYKAIDAAVNPSDFDAAKKAFNNAAYAVKGNADLVFDAAFTNAVTYANGDIQAYITLLNSNAATADNQIDASDYDAAGVTKWFKVNGARTAADVTAMTATLKAEIAALPTVGQLKAQKTAVNNQIAALPGTLVLTFADKAAVEAAYDAVVEAKEAGITGISEDALKTVIVKMNELEVKEVVKAYKTIQHGTATTVTIADKETVLAAKAVYDAYAEGHATEADDGMYTYASAVENTDYETLLGSVCTAGSLYNAIRTLELADINDSIADVNEKTSLADLKALKEKCEAFVKEYDCVKAPHAFDAAEEITNANKVDTLIAAAEEAAKWTDKDVKAAMYDVAKTTSYTKPSKTSVKLTAKADMTEIKENGYTVKYRFYQKGPKKTSYKLWKTSTSGAYTFKGLKKGTHSFKVKVSVYNAEGKLVAYKYTNVRTLKIK